MINIWLEKKTETCIYCVELPLVFTLNHFPMPDTFTVS